MTVRQWSDALTAATVVLSITSYAMADRFVELALGAVPLTLLGWFVADVRRIAITRRPLSDILVIAAIAWSAYRVRSLGWVEGLTVSVFCEFLTSIILVKMWDRKQARDIAQILTLSVFLSVGSMLTGTSLGMAVLLIVNLAALLTAVSVFHIAAGIESVGGHEDEQTAAPNTGVRSRGHFAATVAFAFLLGLCLSGLIFLVMPRGIGSGFAGRVGQPTGGRQTGLTDHVDLRQSGLISESARTVLLAEFEDLRGNAIGGDGRVFYLRAAVLDAYDGRAWTSSGREQRLFDEAHPQERISLGGVPGQGGIVQRVVMLDAARRGPIPHVYRAVEVWSDTACSFQTGSSGRTLTRTGEPGRVAYTVTSGPPAHRSTETFDRTATAKFNVDAVRTITRRVLSDSAVEPDPALRARGLDFEACVEIERYLRGTFTYTLDPGAPPARTDPIEWFLTEGRAGHCEYFASAMAGMCRSAGINARVVAGYAAGEFDQETGRYTVRESNAHAWVEAEVDDGLWWTFDPTPQDTLRSRLRPPTGLAAAWAGWLDRLNTSWSSSFISFDENSRRKLLGFSADPEPWLRAKLDSLRVQYDEEGWRGAFPIVVKAAVGTVVACVIAVVVIRVSRGTVARLLAAMRHRSALRGDPELARAMGNTEFFRRATTLLRKRGFVKPEWQPPGAFAAEIAAREPRLGAVAVLATGLYYRARYGRRPLGEDELREVHRVLDEAARF